MAHLAMNQQAFIGMVVCTSICCMNIMNHETIDIMNVLQITIFEIMYEMYYKKCIIQARNKYRENMKSLK